MCVGPIRNSIKSVNKESFLLLVILKFGSPIIEREKTTQKKRFKEYFRLPRGGEVQRRKKRMAIRRLRNPGLIWIGLRIKEFEKESETQISLSLSSGPWFLDYESYLTTVGSVRRRILRDRSEGSASFLGHVRRFKEDFQDCPLRGAKNIESSYFPVKEYWQRIIEVKRFFSG